MKKLLQLTFPVALWCTANVINNLLVKNKCQVIEDHNHPISEWIELTALQHLTALAFSIVFVVVLRQSLLPLSPDLKHNLIICAAAICNTVANLAINTMFAIRATSLSFAIEATQPLLTLLFLVLLPKVRDHSNILSQFCCLLVVAVGASVFATKDDSVMFTVRSVIAALILTTALAARNVLLKELDVKGYSTNQMFMYISFLGSLFTAPVWLIIKLASAKKKYSTMKWTYLLSSASYTVLSQSSLTLLKHLHPIVHAILTVVIKAASTLAGVADLEDLKVFYLLSGTFTVVIGLYFYQWKTTKLRSKWLCAISSMVSIWILYKPLVHYYYYPMPLTAYFNRDSVFNTTECDRVFTAWVYEKPMPDFVVDNIVTLAHQNPSMLIHVYCGSTQCVEVLEKQKVHNMVTKFTIVTEIVAELPPLKQWLDRHPLNKILAGKRFEDHLQDVTIMGYFWKHGGLYVNPTLKLGSSLNNICQDTNNAWIGKSLALPVESSQPPFELAFFLSKHLFIQELANVYTTKYLKDTNLYQTNYMRAVWDEVLRSNCTVSVPCPSTHTLDIMSQGSIESVNHFADLSGPLSNSSMTIDECLWEYSGIQFLPFVDTHIDLNQPVCNDSTTAFYNGWGKTVLPRSLDPVILSVQIEKSRNPAAELINYFKSNEPIGCGDLNTMNLLMKENVNAFLSGSLMLLMSSTSVENRHGIYITKLDDEIFNLLPTQIQKTTVHTVQDDTTRLNAVAKFNAAYELLEKCKSAELVVTQCFHCASACVALGTPVIFIDQSSRMPKLASIFHTLDISQMTNDQAKDWLSNFPWHNIPPNPNLNEMMRLRASSWNVIRQNQALHDTARKFGLIPLLPPRILSSDQKIIFHMIFTSSSKNTLTSFGESSSIKQSGAFNWRHMRSVESIFRHHPTSDVIIHSNTLSQSTFDALSEAGYSVRVNQYNLEELLMDSPAEKFAAQLYEARTGRFWVYNECDLLRLLVLYKWGGVYMDTDIILVRPLTSLPVNGIGWEDISRTHLNGAFLMFQKAHSFIREMLVNFVENYNGCVWGTNGPTLVTKVWHLWKNSNGKPQNESPVELYNHTAFYMIFFRRIKEECFELTSGRVFDTNMKTLHNKAYGVHVNAKITGYLGVSDGTLKKGTLCSHLFNAYCVLCDHTY